MLTSLFVLGGCGREGQESVLPEGSIGPESGAGSGAGDAEVWRLSETPVLEIGVREGEEEYQLDRATGSARFADGRVVVLDGGSRQLRFFDSTGVFLGAVGMEGEGPGEFRNPTRLRRTFGDSIQVWDARLSRLSFFDDQGSFLGSRVEAPSPEDPMLLDEWLFGRNWIDSPLPPASRGPIRRAILAMPAPDSLGPPRFLKVTRQGRIWAAGSFPPSPEPLAWTVYDLAGRVVATVETPPRFEPHEIGSGFVLGRYRDELDLNYIRGYRLEKPEGSISGPGLDPEAMRASSEPAFESAVLDSETLDELQGLVRQALMATAAAQEIHYSTNYSYTTDTEALAAERSRRFEMPEGIDVAILLADERGWTGTATHRETQVTCALAYGSHLPMGWPPGGFVCP